VAVSHPGGDTHHAERGSFGGYGPASEKIVCEVHFLGNLARGSADRAFDLLARLECGRRPETREPLMNATNRSTAAQSSTLRVLVTPEEAYSASAGRGIL